MLSTRKRAGQTTEVPAKRLKAANQDDHDFQCVSATLTLSLPPIFSSNPRAGVQEMLDSMVMRYIPALQGVVLSHSNSRFLKNSATVQGDCPFLTCEVGFDTIVWCPRVGSRLSGSVNLCSPDHISLLVHRTFNVSIPRNHIPGDSWIFEYGPAANDPEYAEAAEVTEGESTQRSNGQWVHHITHDKLGGEDGNLEFTVIGLTVANEMLSLRGSLQPDPFSPRHNVTQSQQIDEDEGSEEEGGDSDEGESEATSSGSEGEGGSSSSSVGRRGQRKRSK